MMNHVCAGTLRVGLYHTQDDGTWVSLSSSSSSGTCVSSSSTTYFWSSNSIAFNKGITLIQDSLCSALSSCVASLRGFKTWTSCFITRYSDAERLHWLYNPFFLSANLAFLSFSHNISDKSYYKTTVLEYLDLTVLLESLDLTALLEYFIWQPNA